VKIIKLKRLLSVSIYRYHSLIRSFIRQSQSLCWNSQTQQNKQQLWNTPNIKTQSSHEN